MSGVLIDACGWVALVDARLNLDSAMLEVAGSPNYILLNSVNKELHELSKRRGGLLLELLSSRCEMREDVVGMNHTDDMLVDISKTNGWPVLTVDRRLKERLVSVGASYIEVTSGPALRLVGSI
ncbi:MAG: hypothetical protein QF500_00080 [Candidatus Thalassarchaeaceae archaeon]|nr:hypothetical protein [Candidatus Thalassarchaeaceae archaeon]HJN70378.1 hypothetical protein [Candidatus Thalassarchaeaceae archaeon]